MNFIEPDFKLDFVPLENPEEELDDEPAPDDLVFADQPFSIDFHPSDNVFATGLVSGAVYL